MRRALAVVAAVAMLGGAWWLRTSIHDGDDDGNDGGGPVASVVLRCDDVVAPVCARLSAEGAVTSASSEPPGRSVDSDDRATPHVWLVAEPWAEMAEPGLVLADPVGWSPLTLVVWNDRAAVLDAACPALDWVCLGDLAGSPWADHGGAAGWGFVTPAHPGLDTTAGLVAVGQFTGQHFAGRGIDPVATNDFDTEFRSALGRLERSLPRTTTVESMLQLGPAALDAGADVEARVASLVAASREAANLSLIVPGDPAYVRLTLVGRGGAEVSDPLRRAVVAALADAGWLVDTGDDIGAPPSGLPNAGVLAALRTLAAEVR